jgi:hypothetical protein
MEGLEDFLNNSQGPAEWLLDNIESGPNNSGDLDQDMIDDYVSPYPDEKLEGPDTPVPATKIEDCQNSCSQSPTTPIQLRLRSNISTPLSNMKVPQDAPGLFTASGAKLPITTNRPSFFNPSNGPIYPAPRSIFGPPLAQNTRDSKNVGAEDNCFSAPASEYQEPIRSQNIASQTFHQSH